MSFLSSISIYYQDLASFPRCPFIRINASGSLYDWTSKRCWKLREMRSQMLPFQSCTLSFTNSYLLQDSQKLEDYCIKKEQHKFLESIRWIQRLGQALFFLSSSLWILFIRQPSFMCSSILPAAWSSLHRILLPRDNCTARSIMRINPENGRTYEITGPIELRFCQQVHHSPAAVFFLFLAAGYTWTFQEKNLSPSQDETNNGWTGAES